MRKFPKLDLIVDGDGRLWSMGCNGEYYVVQLDPSVEGDYSIADIADEYGIVTYYEGYDNDQ